MEKKLKIKNIMISLKNLGGFILVFLAFQGVHAASILRIVGSSSVFPFAATVAEHFHYKTQEPTPLVESIGTGAGIKVFCDNINGPDGAITSRPMTEGERKKCSKQGIIFEEFKIGQDGLVLILNKETSSFPLAIQDLKDALSERVSLKKECFKNPYKAWNEIKSSFPAYPIRVLGPAPTSGTYDVLVDKIRSSCGAELRHDGAYIEAPANENLIVQKVLNAPHTMGIVTFSFYDQNSSHLDALSIDGVSPTFHAIQKGDYPLSRPLFLYIKTNNRGLRERALYAVEFTSEAAIGEKGYLNEKGLIPLSLEEQIVMHERAKNLLEEVVK